MRKRPLYARRYEVHLPVILRTPDSVLIGGETDLMSTRDVRFRLEKPQHLHRGSRVTLYVSLPPEMTSNHHVLICARGKVSSVRRVSRSRECSELTAALDSYTFVGKNAIPVLAPPPLPAPPRIQGFAPHVE